jgi:hypothetical protein
LKQAPQPQAALLIDRKYRWSLMLKSAQDPEASARRSQHTGVEEQVRLRPSGGEGGGIINCPACVDGDRTQTHTVRLALLLHAEAWRD